MLRERNTGDIDGPVQDFTIIHLISLLHRPLTITGRRHFRSMLQEEFGIPVGLLQATCEMDNDDECICHLPPACTHTCLMRTAELFMLYARGGPGVPSCLRDARRQQARVVMSQELMATLSGLRRHILDA